MTGIGHNSGDTPSAERLIEIIEAFEHLDVEKREIAGQQKVVMADAKGEGYDTKVLKKLIALRKRDPSDVAEEEAILDVYKSAIGMS